MSFHAPSSRLQAQHSVAGLLPAPPPPAPLPPTLRRHASVKAAAHRQPASRCLAPHSLQLEQRTQQHQQQRRGWRQQRYVTAAAAAAGEAGEGDYEDEEEEEDEGPPPTPEEMAEAEAVLREFIEGMGAAGDIERPDDLPGACGNCRWGAACRRPTLPRA